MSIIVKCITKVTRISSTHNGLSSFQFQIRVEAAAEVFITAARQHGAKLCNAHFSIHVGIFAFRNVEMKAVFGLFENVDLKRVFSRP